MDNKEFKCDYIFDLDKYNEFIEGFNSTNILRRILKVMILFCFSVYFLESFLIAKDYKGIVFYAVILIFIGMIFYNNKGKGNVQYKRMLSMNKGKPAHNLLTIDKNGIHQVNPDNENKNEYTFDQIISIIETQNLFILMMNYRLGLIVDKSSLTGGSNEEFVNFIFENSKNIKKKKVKKANKSKSINIIVAITLIVVLCIVLGYRYKKQKEFEYSFINNNYGKEVENINNKTYQELADILEELGITNISEDTINQLESEWKEYPEHVISNKMAMLLSTVGYGDYDYNTGEWTPSSNKVYSFDMECYDIDNMYQLLFLGIASIGNDELKFTNISIDTSKVEYNRGTGTQTIKFDLNGKTHVLEGDYHNDWYDIEILDYLNEILENENSTKKLYFMSDGYQSCIVFYCNEEWADLFEEKTGCKLVIKSE